MVIFPIGHTCYYLGGQGGQGAPDCCDGAPIVRLQPEGTGRSRLVAVKILKTVGIGRNVMLYWFGRSLADEWEITDVKEVHVVVCYLRHSDKK